MSTQVMESHANWCPGAEFCTCSFDILDRALTLKMACDGSMDGFWLTPDYPAKLKWRVDHWRPSLLDSAFDDACKQVAIEALLQAGRDRSAQNLREQRLPWHLCSAGC